MSPDRASGGAAVQAKTKGLKHAASEVRSACFKALIKRTALLPYRIRGVCISPLAIGSLR
jgi:hypothetical protein